MPRRAVDNHYGSAAFNGSTSIIDGPSLATAAATTASSLMMWVKFNALTSSYATVAQWGSSGTSRFIIQQKKNGNRNALTFGYYNGSAYTANAIDDILPGRWYCVVATFDGTTPKLYIDGVRATGTGTSPQSDVTSVIKLGSRGGGLQPMTGSIGTTAYYTRVVTASEIVNFYTNMAIPASPYFYYNFKDANVSTVTDYSGNSRTATGTAITYTNDSPSTLRPPQNISRCSATGSAVSAVGTIDTTTSLGGTMMGWAKVNAYSGQTMAVFYAANGIDEAWRLTIESTTGYPFIWTINTSASGSVNPKPTIPVPLNKWFHIAATQEISGSSLTGKLYVNGILWKEQTQTRDVRACSRFFLTSTSSIKTTKWSAYDRVLTIDEIRASYSSGNAASRAKIIWNRNEGAGNINYDSSGNGYNGTAGTLTWYSDSPVSFRSNVNGNLVPNGDFSFKPVFIAATTTSSRFIDGTSGGSTTNSLFGWSMGKFGSVTALFDTSNLSPLGSTSLKLSTLATGSYIEVFTPSNTGAIIGYFGKTAIPVLPSTSYTYSFYMKTRYVSGDSSTGAGVSFIFSNGDGSSASSQTNSTTVKTTTGWTRYSGTITTVSAARFLQPNPVVYGHTGAATLIMDAWFANIKFVPTTAIARLTT